MVTTWSWDPSLYSGSAAYYARGRAGYPQAIAEALSAEPGPAAGSTSAAGRGR